MVKKQRTSEYSALPAALILGTVVSMVATTLISAFAAFLIAGERVGESRIGIASVAALVLSSAAGAWVAFHKVGHHRLIVCLAAGGTYFLTLLACSALLFDGAYQGMGVTALAVIGGSGGAALLTMKSGTTGRKHRYQKHHNIKLVQNRQTGNI